MQNHWAKQSNKERHNTTTSLCWSSTNCMYGRIFLFWGNTGTTCDCEQSFKKLTLAKVQVCSILRDLNLKDKLRVASLSLSSDMRRLAEDKQFQSSSSEWLWMDVIKLKQFPTPDPSRHVELEVKSGDRQRHWDSSSGENVYVHKILHQYIQQLWYFSLV